MTSRATAAYVRPDLFPVDLPLMVFRAAFLARLATADRKDQANAVLWWPDGAAEPRFTAPNELAIELTATTVIYKMHGSLVRDGDSWDNFVITEEDYVEFLSRMTTNTAIPSLFFPHFRDRSFLFLGYSLRDWNLRVVLKNLGNYLAGRSMGDDDQVLPSCAIQQSPPSSRIGGH